MLFMNANLFRDQLAVKFQEPISKQETGNQNVDGCVNIYLFLFEMQVIGNSST